jgi:nucleoid-associated protein YgaU
MALRLIEVRQPREHDVIARRFVVAGFGTGFEATILWRVLDEHGAKLGEGPVVGGGSMGVLDDFGHEITLGGAQARGAHVILQVFGDDPSGQHPPGPDLNQIRVTLFTDMQGWKLYEVRSGDNLTKIAREQGQHTTADDIFEANRDKITNPNLIFPGQIFRIPLLRH